MSTINIDAADVFIKRLEKELCDCGKPQTHEVYLDLRNCGLTMVSFTGYRACAQGFATRLKASLPRETP